MPRNPDTGLYTRVDNTFSNPVIGDIIAPTDADDLWDDLTDALNNIPPAVVDGPFYFVVCDTTGATDVTDDIQEKIDEAGDNGGGAVILPSGTLLVNGGLIFGAGGITLMGQGWQDYNGIQSQFAPAQQGHNGTYIKQTTTANSIITIKLLATGTRICHVAFVQTHMAEGPGWTPTLYPPAITTEIGVAGDAGTIDIYGVMFWGINECIYLGNENENAVGRVSITNIKMDCITSGIKVNFSGDVVKTENIHIWPFALTGSFQMAYKLANAIAYDSYRNDVPFISNFFALSIRIGISLTVNDDGITNNLVGSNIVIDGCQYGIFVEGSNADSVYPKASFANVTIACTAVGSRGVVCTDGQLKFANLKILGSDDAPIVVDGTSHVSITNLETTDCRTGGAGSAIVGGSGNSTIIVGGAFVRIGANITSEFSGSGTFSSPATTLLGASGVFGSLRFGNATSGILTLQTVTGALGTVTLSLPAATDTLVGKATTDILTNKSIAGATWSGTWAGTPTFSGEAFISYANIQAGLSRSLLGVAANAVGANASIQGAAGQIPHDNGATIAFTATPTLGASGTLGSLTLGNATSGLVTLRPVTGALGTVTVSLPAATDTLVGKATTDTLTNKTFDTAGTGNSFSINGLATTSNTGTGSVVRATSPTLVTPVLGVATGTSFNGNTITTGTGTLTLSSSAALTATTTTSVGRGQYLATGANDDATAGNIGEYVEAVVTVGSPVSMAASTTTYTITTISLGVGDWDVTWQAVYSGNPTTTLFGVEASISQSAVWDANPGKYASIDYSGAVAFNNILSPGITHNLGPVRVKLSGTTTIFGLARAVYGVSTLNGSGVLHARRVR